MRRVIGWIVVAGIVVAAAWWLMGLPGLVSAQIGDTAIQAPTPVFILAMLVLFIVAYAVVRLLGGIFGSRRRMRRRNERVRRRRGDAAVTRALLALAAGDGSNAGRHAERSRKLLGDTPQTLLLTAYAGRLAGREDASNAAFQALADRDDASFLGLRGLMQQAIGREDWVTAAELSRRAEEASPGAPWLRAQQAQLAIHNGSWKQAMMLSEKDGPIAAFATAASAQEPDGSEAQRLAKQAWEADPSLVPAALAYARQLRAVNKESRAQEVLRSTWSMTPHPDVASLYLAAASDDRIRMRQAESLAAAAPQRPESSLMVAKVAFDAGLMGEAQRNAALARQQGMNQRQLWLLQAEIASRTADHNGHAEAMRHAADADPDPVWRCGQCGTIHATWHPVCDVCHAPGRIAWATGTLDSQPVRLIAASPSDGLLS